VVACMWAQNARAVDRSGEPDASSLNFLEMQTRRCRRSPERRRGRAIRHKTVLCKRRAQSSTKPRRCAQPERTLRCELACGDVLWPPASAEGKMEQKSETAR